MRTYPHPSICTDCGEAYDRPSLREPEPGRPPERIGQCNNCVGLRNADNERSTRKAWDRQQKQIAARQRKKKGVEKKPEPPEDRWETP